MSPAFSYQDFFKKNLPVPTAERIRSQIETYVACLQLFGKTANGFSQPPMSNFAKSSDRARQRAELYLQLNIEVMQEVIESGEPADDRRLLWRILSKAKMTPTSDVLDRISDGDVVEVYLAKEQLQIFRNLAFFDICTLPIEDLLFLPWYKLTKRKLKDTLVLFKAVLQLQLGLIRETMLWNVPTHRIVEASGEGREIDISMKYLSPAFYNGKVVGCVSTNRSVVR